jgi:uncharacterized protein
MEIYLPIAEMSVNVLSILALGFVSGSISGMFGVGGGFLTTPFLIFIGIPPAVAVASSANQIVATSFFGFLSHWRRSNVDFQMGGLLVVGGITGSSVGVWLFSLLKASGHIDLVISLLYIALLGSIGVTMGLESLRFSVEGKPSVPAAVQRFAWMKNLPMMRVFDRSKLELSALLPLGIGFVSGLIVSLLGVGGGFFTIPAMIYLLGMPTSVVIGTSLFQIIFITANVTLLQAITTHTVDIMLALLLLTGSVIGAQVGTRIGAKVSAVKLRGMLALIVLTVAMQLLIGLTTTPDQIYTVTTDDQ